MHTVSAVAHKMRASEREKEKYGKVNDIKMVYLFIMAVHARAYVIISDFYFQNRHFSRKMKKR